jgi:Mat/Ecp fimbriae major subunit
MKNSMIKALAGAAFLASALGATSAQAATADADAKATILTKVEVTKVANTNLDFGTIAIGTLAATGSADVVVSNAGSRTSCGTGLVCSGTVDVAEFNVSGSVGEMITISVPTSVVLDHATIAGASMSASLTTNADTTSHALTASESFAVGGTLTVGGSQDAGAYSGTFTVTANYQ